MARSSEKSSKPKQPGRIKQMWQVFQMTRRYDASAQWLMLLGFVAPIIVGVGLGILLGNGNGFTIALWIVAGVLAGILVALIILGRLAEKAAYSQIEGKPGAVGSVLRSSLRRGWIGSEMPVAVNGKTQDAIYRAVGRGGVVLIAEGSPTRTSRMLDDEKRKISRILGAVPVHFVTVGRGEGQVPLHKLAGSLNRFKKTLTKAEVLAVSNRLSSINTQLPIPKGIDPFKVRAQRGR